MLMCISWACYWSNDKKSDIRHEHFGPTLREPRPAAQQKTERKMQSLALYEQHPKPKSRQVTPPLGA